MEEDGTFKSMVTSKKVWVAIIGVVATVGTALGAKWALKLDDALTAQIAGSVTLVASILIHAIGKQDTGKEAAKIQTEASLKMHEMTMAANATNAQPISAAMMRSDAPAVDPQKGSIKVAVMLMLLAVTTSFVVVGAMSCSSVKNGGKTVLSAIVDCTKVETKTAVHDLRPLADNLLVGAINGKNEFDAGMVKSMAKSYASDVGRCVIADAITRALAPKPTDPNAPKLSPLDVSEKSLRDGFAAINADWGGKEFKTESGSIK